MLKPPRGSRNQTFFLGFLGWLVFHCLRVFLGFLGCSCFLVFWEAQKTKQNHANKQIHHNEFGFCGFACFLRLLGFLGCPRCLGCLGFLGCFGFLGFAWCAQHKPNFRHVQLHNYPASCGRGDNCPCGRE